MDKAKSTLSIIFAFLIISILISVYAMAKPNTDRVTATNVKSGNVVVIPANAVEVAPDVFSLGTATDVDGRVVEGFMFVDRKRENAKPPWAGGGGGGATKCYSFLAKGAKWKVLEPWVVNPANTEGLSDSFVLGNLAADITKWEDASSTNILGSGSINTSNLVADTQSTDGANEVYFGDVDSPGAIAVTIVWGIFSGPSFARELVEWDQIYDQVDYDWSSTGQADKMDFENIATHELGHSVGMGHPPSECTEETMYAYAGFGETKKRDLNAGDITGVNELY
ncbi:matrixin family metalloprotease [Candidatus Woesearchaeota archaeon]|nr:matrixin family metalloprotease [Candidatus Woesearchaeota archaeon]